MYESSISTSLPLENHLLDAIYTTSSLTPLFNTHTFFAQSLLPAMAPEPSPEPTPESLQAINSKTLGTSAGAFPVVTLPSGERIPTGTVGALLVNVRAYDAAAATGDAAAQDTLSEALRAAVPVLHKVGLFALFAPEEWASDKSPGRSLVGEMAKELN
ncbi:hypothetical protein G3M48_003161 [Beauveria asiatica]|uniref:DUF7709 domain-containing protein n=1 Tax=Beauveria asiatica TaxID=1069075 RepID=A0AAW0RWK4_9HYPO